MKGAEGFTKDQDELLVKLVLSTWPLSWAEISKYFPGKSSRDCRSRYEVYLTPKLSEQKSWTKEEDALLQLKLGEMGKNWEKLKFFFPDKSLESIINRATNIIAKEELERTERRNWKCYNASDENVPICPPEVCTRMQSNIGPLLIVPKNNLERNIIESPPIKLLVDHLPSFFSPKQ